MAGTGDDHDRSRCVLLKSAPQPLARTTGRMVDHAGGRHHLTVDLLDRLQPYQAHERRAGMPLLIQASPLFKAHDGLGSDRKRESRESASGRRARCAMLVDRIHSSNADRCRASPDNDDVPQSRQGE